MNNHKGNCYTLHECEFVDITDDTRPTAFDKRNGLWRYFFNGKKELVDFSLEN